MDPAATLSDTAVAAILALVTAGFTGLFVALRQAYSDHLKSKDAEIDRLFDLARSTTNVAEKTVVSSRRRP